MSATGSVTNHTGATFDLECGGADVTLKLQDPDNVYIKFKSPTCSGSGVVALVDNNKLEGKIKIGGRNWGLKFRNITRETASGDAEDGSVETTSSSSAKTGPSAATDQFLGVWAGEIFNNPDLPMIVEIKIDENDSVSASGSIVNQASSFRLNCNNAEVTLKLQDADNVYIKFKNPTCGGSGVVSLVGNNRLKGKITLEGRSWDLNFTKSSGP